MKTSDLQNPQCQETESMDMWVWPECIPQDWATSNSWLPCKGQEHEKVHLKDKTACFSKPIEDLKNLNGGKDKQFEQFFRPSLTASTQICGYFEVATDSQRALELMPRE